MRVGNQDIMLRYLRRLSSNSKRNLFATNMVNLKPFKRKCSSAVEASRIDNPEVASSNDGVGRRRRFAIFEEFASMTIIWNWHWEVVKVQRFLSLFLRNLKNDCDH